MSESHFDLGFSPAASSRPQQQQTQQSPIQKTRHRQSSLSSRIFGSIVGSSSNQDRDRQPSSSKSSIASSRAAYDSDTNDSRPASPIPQSTPLSHQQKRQSILPDWSSVISWRKKHSPASAPPESVDHDSSIPEEEHSTPGDSSAEIEATPSPEPSQSPDTDLTPTNNPQSETLQRSASISSVASHATTLASSYHAVDARPSIEAVLGQDQLPGTEEERQSLTVDSSSPSRPSTPSSAVRALISRRQVEPPALSLAGTATAAVPGATSSASSEKNQFATDQPSRDTSPLLRQAPDANILPHDSGAAPLIVATPTEERANVLEQSQSDPGLEPNAISDQTLESKPSPTLSKSGTYDISRSHSYSSQLSQNSSNKDLSRNGSGYVTNMLSKTMAFVTPNAPATPKQGPSNLHEGRTEPAVTLPSLGMAAARQGPVFQLAPPTTQTAAMSGASQPSASNAPSAPPPASMELTTLVTSEARPPTFGGANGTSAQGMEDFVDRYGFLHERNGMATYREIRQRQQDHESGSSANLIQEPSESNNETSVKRLLAQLDEMNEADERQLMSEWDAFLKRRRAQLAPHESSTARKERTNSLAQSTKGGRAAALNASFSERDEDTWTENLIGVARLGTSGKEGKETWKEFKRLVSDPSHTDLSVLKNIIVGTIRHSSSGPTSNLGRAQWG